MLWPVSSGILYTLTHGLFFLSRGGNGNRRSCRALVLAFAMCTGIFARRFSVPLLEIMGLASDPPRAIGLLVNGIKWFMTGAGILCAICFYFLKTEKNTEQIQQEHITKTDWVMIARLVGLSVVFSLINAVMEMGLFPFLGGLTVRQYTPHTLTAAAVVCLCAFIAGRSMRGFLRWFLLPAIVLFILLLCLVLFEGYPGFILLMSTLVSVFRFSVWIIFTIAVVDCYAGGFWFFDLASVIYFTNVLSFIGPVIYSTMPSGIEFTVLIMGISAAAFMFLSLRIVFPKTLPVTAAGAEMLSIEDIFRECGLSMREIQADLMVTEVL